MQNHFRNLDSTLDDEVFTSSNPLTESRSGVFGKDARVELTSPVRGRYKAVVKLLLEYDKGLYDGSGVIINDDVILTAAHCIHQPGMILKDVSIKADGQGYVKAEGMLMCQEYAKYLDSPYDWALLRCKGIGGGGNHVSLYNLASSGKKEVESLAVEIAGYPSVAQGTATASQWTARGQIGNYIESTKVLQHLISTSGGQSGGPVFADIKGVTRVIGIHVWSKGAFNEACGVSQVIVDTVKIF